MLICEKSVNWTSACSGETSGGSWFETVFHFRCSIGRFVFPPKSDTLFENRASLSGSTWRLDFFKLCATVWNDEIGRPVKAIANFSAPVAAQKKQRAAISQVWNSHPASGRNWVSRIGPSSLFSIRWFEKVSLICAIGRHSNNSNQFHPLLIRFEHQVRCQIDIANARYSITITKTSLWNSSTGAPQVSNCSCDSVIHQAILSEQTIFTPPDAQLSAIEMNFSRRFLKLN